jgi:hypothetical protein
VVVAAGPTGATYDRSTACPASPPPTAGPWAMREPCSRIRISCPSNLRPRATRG